MDVNSKQTSKYHLNKLHYQFSILIYLANLLMMNIY